MDESHDDFEPRETSYICGRVLHNQVEKPENTIILEVRVNDTSKNTIFKYSIHQKKCEK